MNPNMLAVIIFIGAIACFIVAIVTTFHWPNRWSSAGLALLCVGWIVVLLGAHL